MIEKRGNIILSAREKWFSTEFVDGALNVQNEFVLNIEHKREMGIFSFTKVLINDIEGFYSISIIVSLL